MGRRDRNPGRCLDRFNAGHMQELRQGREIPAQLLPGIMVCSIPEGDVTSPDPATLPGPGGRPDGGLVAFAREELPFSALLTAPEITLDGSIRADPGIAAFSRGYHMTPRTP